MKYWLLATVAAGSALSAALGFAIHPFGTPRFQDSNLPLLEGALVEPQARAILKRACINCHSETTTWPWYGNFAPPPGCWSEMSHAGGST